VHFHFQKTLSARLNWTENNCTARHLLAENQNASGCRLKPSGRQFLWRPVNNGSTVKPIKIKSNFFLLTFYQFYQDFNNTFNSPISTH
jgi:hypothetical protein